MKYVFKDLANIKKKLQESNFVLLLDFDLTLSPLAKNPAKAILPNDTRILLKKLSKYIHIAVITGRTIKNIKKKYSGVLIEDKKLGLALHYRLLLSQDKFAFMADIKKIQTEIKNYGL